MHPSIILIASLLAASAAQAAPSYCNGAPMDSYGARKYPNGAPVESFGTPLYPNGLPTLSFGTVKYPNGNPVTSYGTMKYPNGAPVTSYGNLRYPNGNPVTLHGACRWANGKMMEPCRERVRLRSPVGPYEMTLWLNIKEQKLESQAELSYKERGTEVTFSLDLKTGAVSDLEGHCD